MQRLVGSIHTSSERLNEFVRLRAYYYIPTVCEFLSMTENTGDWLAFDPLFPSLPFPSTQVVQVHMNLEYIFHNNYSYTLFTYYY